MGSRVGSLGSVRSPHNGVESSLLGGLGSVRSPHNGVESSLLGSLGSVRTPHNGVESTSSAKISVQCILSIIQCSIEVM